MDWSKDKVRRFPASSTALEMMLGQSMSAGFQILTKAAAPSAFYDSGHQLDVPRCHENTRVAVLEKLGDWFNLLIDVAAFIMWLYGAAGAGKSAIARTMAEILHDRQQLLATFFFSRQDSSRNHIKSVIATLAYKVALTIPEARPLIVTAIENDPLIFHSTCAHQLKQLIIEPLRRLSQHGVVYPTVIVIDGLDECFKHDERITLMHAISTTAGQASAPLKFLITSRPEVPITRVFNTVPLSEVSTRHSLDDEPESIEDVEYFLSAKFDEIKRTHPSRSHIPHDWPLLQVKADLVQKSSGQFIYPATIIRYISSPRHNPTRRLDIVLKLKPHSGESPFAQLDVLYRYIFLSCENVELALRIVGVCLLSTRNICPPWGIRYSFPSQFTVPKYMEPILGLHPGDVQCGLEDLGSLIEYKGDHIELRVLHASLFDFLSDPARFMELPFNLSSIYTDLAIWCSYLDPHRDNVQIPGLHGECDLIPTTSRQGESPKTMLILYMCTGRLFPLFYSAIVKTHPTDALEERLHQMTLPDPSLPMDSPVDYEILYFYPYVIEFLQDSVRSNQYGLYL